MDARKKRGLNLIESLRLRSQQPCCGPLERQYLADRLSDTNRLYAKDLKGHFGCVNALCFSHNSQEHLASGGDDRRILIWSMGSLTDGLKQPSPRILKSNHHSNIFTLSFSCDNKCLLSAGNDGMIIAHDLKSGEAVQTYQHLGPVYCVDSHPSSPHSFSAATDDGNIYLVDSRAPRLSQEMIVDESIHSYHAVSMNPMDPHLLAAGNESSGGALYDLRSWKKVLSYKTTDMILPWMKCDIVGINFNSVGSKVFVMQKSRPPQIFSTFSSEPDYCCVDDEGTYCNSVTMKSGCFAGDQDQYVVSGSDDFRVYWWKLPAHKAGGMDGEGSRQEITPHLVMPGHRSIVNQTRYSTNHHILVSSGVEKSIKLWTPFHLHQDQTPIFSRGPPARGRYSYFDLLNMTLASGELSDEDVDSDTVEESERVLAFFDQLIQEENVMEDSSSESPSDEEDDDTLWELRVGPLFRRIIPSSDSEDDDEEEQHQRTERRLPYNHYMYGMDSINSNHAPYDSVEDSSGIGLSEIPDDLGCNCTHSCPMVCVQVVPETVEPCEEQNSHVYPWRVREGGQYEPLINSSSSSDFVNGTRPSRVERSTECLPRNFAGSSSSSSCSVHGADFMEGASLRPCLAPPTCKRDPSHCSASLSSSPKHSETLKIFKDYFSSSLPSSSTTSNRTSTVANIESETVNNPFLDTPPPVCCDNDSRCTCTVDSLDSETVHSPVDSDDEPSI